jgi:Tfp pilus assembly protein PilZ
MNQFKTLRGRRILIEVPEKKESIITLSEKDKDALMYEAMKAWNRLTIYAVGDKVEDVVVGDVVYIAVSQLEHAEKVDIDGSVKLMLNEMDIAIIW